MKSISLKFLCYTYDWHCQHLILYCFCRHARLPLENAVFFSWCLCVFNAEEVAILPEAHEHDSLFSMVVLPDFFFPLLLLSLPPLLPVSLFFSLSSCMPSVLLPHHSSDFSPSDPEKLGAERSAAPRGALSLRRAHSKPSLTP